MEALAGGSAFSGQWPGLRQQTGKDYVAYFARPQRATGRTREGMVTLAVERTAAVTGKPDEICATVKERMDRMQSSSRVSSPAEVFEGLNGRDTAVGICQSRNLPPAMSLEEAMTSIRMAVEELEHQSPPFESGTLRFQVPLPPDLKALQWLQSQPQHTSLLPRSYFSPRENRDTGGGQKTKGTPRQYLKLDASGVGGVAGIGAAVLFNGSKSFSVENWKAIKRFLSKRHSLIRAYGAMRFDPNVEPSCEWKPFGSFYFFIPQIEFCECQGCSLLAVTLAWDEGIQWPFIKALRKALKAMQMVSNRICPDSERPLAEVLNREHIPNEQAWHEGVKKTVGSLRHRQVAHSISDQQGSSDPSMVQRSPALSKVVMARRTELEMNDQLDPVSLLACLQDKDPSAYQFVLQVPDGSAFIGCSPERLFARNQLLVASEAVAGTRARGSTGIRDLQLGTELMESAKDHVEFEIVRENVKHHMKAVCKHVDTQTAKGLLKQARVQHLYARFNGELHSESGEFDILSTLNPTPAVCGYPQAEALEQISANEAFDRGLYAGPVGWFGGDGAEFAVGIRSALIQPLKINHLQSEFYSRLSDKIVNMVQASSSGSENGSKLQKSPSCGTRMFLYVGVGVVKDSISTAEWSELELKTSLFESLLEQRQPLENVVNINALWAKLIVEECCRLGITYFCVAPGSRSSPITTAAAANPRVTCVTCIDERSMAYHALGYGRGANKAAAVITSSGTAVPNLFPAVVEASQDFVPLVILTADRPAELFDSGANQTIDQGKHFGGFVRYHANLPTADDGIPAKLVLTTIDTAVNRAMTMSPGPVHINCQFREPLAGANRVWKTECLGGLNRWSAASSPYTQYISSRPRLLGGAPPNFQAHFSKVGELIANAREGLLVVGGLSAAEETWAVALLAQHLGWPLIPDVVSGLRIGEALFTSGVTGRKVNVIHNFDQILLSKDVADRFKPDVVLQIGSRLTSKRLSQFLEAANLQAYILVEEHSSRHDPSHIITHRIQSSTADFAFTTMKVTEQRPPTAVCAQLQYLSRVAEQEICLKLKAEPSLTEPLVARYVVSCLPLGCALFLGSSMPIRDVDMYAQGALKVLGNLHEGVLDHSLAKIGTRVGANRGASGIDGVLSTAIGFGAGSGQRVTLLLGDVSFLHDTNGLAFLSERPAQPPVTVVVVNNGGGGIFSLLPIADIIPEDTFAPFFTTPHDVDLKRLCQAHRVCHWLIKSKEELQTALNSVNGSPLHLVIEVESKIDKNANFHRFLSGAIGVAVTQAFNTVSKTPVQSVCASDPGLKIVEAKIARHSYPLLAPPTGRQQHCSTERMRKGSLLRVALFNGSSGLREIAPLDGVSHETLLDVEEQLRIIVKRMSGLFLIRSLASLDGSFSRWLSETVGLQDNTIFPTVRMGVEMAVLGALAASNGCSLSELLFGMGRFKLPKEDTPGNAWGYPYGTVRVCGLLKLESSLEDAADSAAQLVQSGFCTLKLKVGGRASPLEDAEMVRRVRERVGPMIHLRADANRKWSLEGAVAFGNAVKSCGLQYIEEPVKNPLDIPRFCEETGLSVALDETLEEDLVSVEDVLSTYACPGLVAVVIKPGIVGGFEKTWRIAQWAQRHGIAVVISSAFESSISLAAYSQFAMWVDECAKSSTNRTLDGIAKVAHGLGTYKWLPKDDFVSQCVKTTTTSTEICVTASAEYLQNVCQTMKKNMPNEIAHANVTSYNIKVAANGAVSFHLTELAPIEAMLVGSPPTVVFLHGFMGNGNDWLPTMGGLSATMRCISVDIPGHGQTTVEEFDLRRPTFPEPGDGRDADATFSAQTYDTWSMERLGRALAKLITKLDERKVILVGYSMGARIAMYMALRHSEQVSAAVIVSGSPGLQDALSRRERTEQDDALAESLRLDGLKSFVDKWYKNPLWESLQGHPDFEGMKESRLQQRDRHALAKALAMFSTGRQPSLWKDLESCRVPLLLVVGDLDTKFKGIAEDMLRSCENGLQSHKSDNPQVGRPSQEDQSSFQEDQLQLTNKQSERHTSGAAVKLFEEEEVAALKTERINRILPKLLKVESAGHAVHIESPLRLVKAIREFVLSSWNAIGRHETT